MIDSVSKLFAAPFSLEEVVFVDAKTSVSGLRIEYLIGISGVKFHIWPEPKFPDATEQCIIEAFRGFPKEDTVVEYVPEVTSWYAEIKSARAPFTGMLVEHIIKKIARAMDRHDGQEGR
jgi:hypothetical protein